MNKDLSPKKCPVCGQIQEASKDGWLVDSKIQGKRETRYFEWHHLVGHFNIHGKFCKGSGASLVGLENA